MSVVVFLVREVWCWGVSRGRVRWVCVIGVLFDVCAVSRVVRCAWVREDGMGEVFRWVEL